MVAAAFVIHTIRGIGIASMDVTTNTLIQRLVPRAMLGRVFGNLYGATGAAAGLSYVLGGLLLDLTSPRPTFIIAGAGGLLATLATALALRHTMKRAASHTTTPVEQNDDQQIPHLVLVDGVPVVSRDIVPIKLTSCVSHVLDRLQYPHELCQP